MRKKKWGLMEMDNKEEKWGLVEMDNEEEKVRFSGDG